MGQLTIAPSCPLSIFLQSAPSLACQEYCTLISFFSACCTVHFCCFVFRVTIETGGAPKPWEDGQKRVLEETVPAGQRSLRQESIAVNGKRELRGQIQLCVHRVLGSAGPAYTAFNMSCLQKRIFQRSQCSVGVHRNQAQGFICKKITEVTLTYSFYCFLIKREQLLRKVLFA